MTTGEQLSAWSTVANVSAMEHFMNLAVGGGTVTFIPATTIGADITQSVLGADITQSVLGAEIIHTILTANITQSQLGADVSQIKLEGNL